MQSTGNGHNWPMVILCPGDGPREAGCSQYTHVGATGGIPQRVSKLSYWVPKQLPLLSPVVPCSHDNLIGDKFSWGVVWDSWVYCSYLSLCDRIWSQKTARKYPWVLFLGCLCRCWGLSLVKLCWNSWWLQGTTGRTLYKISDRSVTRSSYQTQIVLVCQRAQQGAPTWTWKPP